MVRREALLSSVVAALVVAPALAMVASIRFQFPVALLVFPAIPLFPALLVLASPGVVVWRALVPATDPPLASPLGLCLVGFP